FSLVLITHMPLLSTLFPYTTLFRSLFFLAEYMNMILISALTVVMFFGGWQAPIESVVTNWVPPFAWLFIKIFLVVSMFLWFRARSEEHTSELQSRVDLVCRLLLEQN